MNHTPLRFLTRGLSASLSVFALGSAAALCQSTCPEQVQALVGQVDPCPGGTAPLNGGWPFPASTAWNPFPADDAPQSELDQRAEQVRLGKVLFWEEQVSIDNTMACGTCHFPEAGGADPRGAFPTGGGGVGSLGVLHQYRASNGAIVYGSKNSTNPSTERQVTSRTAPSMIGAHVFLRMFWSGAVGGDYVDETGAVASTFATVENVSVIAPVNGVEMGHESMTWGDGTLQAKLGASLPMALVDPATLSGDFASLKSTGKTYAELFDDAFAAHPSSHLANQTGVTRDRFAAAVGHYLRTLTPNQAPIDLPGFAPSNFPGFAVFEQSCLGCHSVSAQALRFDPLGGFENPWDAPLSSGQLNFSGIAPNSPLTRIPSLRNVALRPYFFQDGSSTDLADAIERDALAHAGVALTPQQVADLVTFFSVALTDPRVASAAPPFDRPQLASERPELAYGANEFLYASPAVTTLSMLANVPPHVPAPGTPSPFRVGVAGGSEGQATWFVYQVVNSPNLITAPRVFDASGAATVHLPLPPTSALAGLTVEGVWIASAPSLPGGIAWSEAAAWTLFQD